jgi:hypothetical protein
MHDGDRYEVQGHVRLHKVPPDGVCPIKFDSVQGSFVAPTMGLTSCKNLPHTVGGNLMLQGNELKDLSHAPDWVGRFMDIRGNPFHSLVGFPTHVEEYVVITYDPDLPLLRLLSAKQGITFADSATPVKVKQIMINHKGTGKPGALKAAAELIRAGFKENARW